jgi:hypothetical protein
MRFLHALCMMPNAPVGERLDQDLVEHVVHELLEERHRGGGGLSYWLCAMRWDRSLRSSSNGAALRGAALVRAEENGCPTSAGGQVKRCRHYNQQSG